MADNQICIDVKPSGLYSAPVYSAYTELPFDKGKEALESEEYQIISLEENARLLMQEGRNSDIAKWGNWVREGVLYTPRKAHS